jgi:outer membrane lipoprotein SlyB
MKNLSLIVSAVTSRFNEMDAKQATKAVGAVAGGCLAGAWIAGKMSIATAAVLIIGTGAVAGAVGGAMVGGLIKKEDLTEHPTPDLVS